LSCLSHIALATWEGQAIAFLTKNYRKTNRNQTKANKMGCQVPFSERSALVGTGRNARKKFLIVCLFRSSGTGGI
jgi:hypothetical protein